MKRPVPRAVALSYERGVDHAPKVTAKGCGAVAERILALAREHGVSVQEDATLVEALSLLELNEEIPAELYKAVAEILAFVYRVNRGGE